MKTFFLSKQLFHLVSGPPLRDHNFFSLFEGILRDVPVCVV